MKTRLAAFRQLDGSLGQLFPPPPLALRTLQHLAILRSALCMFLCIYSAPLYPCVTLLLVWLPGALHSVAAIKQGPPYGGYACRGAAPPTKGLLHSTVLAKICLEQKSGLAGASGFRLPQWLFLTSQLSLGRLFSSIPSK